MSTMWIEFSLQEAPADHIYYGNVSHLTYTPKHLKIHFKDGSKIKILESELEDVAWGKDKKL